MRNTLISTDRFGDFILSSQVYTNARDLARFGLLYQQKGMWNGERLVSEEWIDFVRTPAPATAAAATSTAATGGSCPTTARTCRKATPTRPPATAASSSSSCRRTTWSSCGAASTSGARASTAGTC
jgi:CubicO group peptidase (beta-lactamase class C family)